MKPSIALAALPVGCNADSLSVELVVCFLAFLACVNTWAYFADRRRENARIQVEYHRWRRETEELEARMRGDDVEGES